MKVKVLFLAAAVTLALAACNKPADKPADAAPTASVGVPECDDYLTKVKACLTDKVPAEQRAGLEGALEQSRTAWTQAASTPQGKAALASACKTALEQSKAQYSAMGCTL